MKIVITGGAGFLGRRLARTLLQRGTLVGPSGAEEPIDTIVVLDTVTPEPAITTDPRLHVAIGDITDRATLAQVIDDRTTSVFHFAAVVSAAAEAISTWVCVSTCTAPWQCLRRAALSPPTTARLHQFHRQLWWPVAAVVDDTIPQTPQTSYGAQKAIGELLVHDYSRKNFVDGRAVRLPTIVVRPGKPNRAASSFASSIIREPLTGLETVCPVSPETRLAILSPRQAVAALYGPMTSQRQRSSTPVPSSCLGSPCRSATWWQRCSAPPEPRRCSIFVGNQMLKSNGSSVAGLGPSPRSGRCVLASRPMPIWTPSCRHLLKTICRRNAPPEHLAV